MPDRLMNYEQQEFEVMQYNGILTTVALVSVLLAPKFSLSQELGMPMPMPTMTSAPAVETQLPIAILEQ
ncbi:MAG: hypothetical protein KBC84_06100, partial [Proteobacteria bacterium]|nr:hypothetical protein [Pseudomonadota bacterium]